MALLIRRRKAPRWGAQVMAPPLISEDVVDYWRYANRCNAVRTLTPLSRPDVARLFAYIQLLEERLKEPDSGFDDLREFLGLGKGVDGAGHPSRAQVRKRLCALERRHDEQSRQIQRDSGVRPRPLSRLPAARAPHVIGICTRNTSRTFQSSTPARVIVLALDVPEGNPQMSVSLPVVAAP